MTAAPHTADNNDSLERLNWLRLARTPRIGPAAFTRLLAMFGSAIEAVAQAPVLARNAGGILRIPSLKEASLELEKCHKFGAQMLIATDTAYPATFRQLPGMPPVIIAKGRVELLNSRQIAIVGARHASAGGMTIAMRMAAELGAAGFIITSGLAKGIDLAAHKGGLKHGTIAVIAGGIDNVYPKENAAWYEKIGQEGVIISEQPFGSLPTAQHFPKRNRLIAALVRAVIVVEAAERSGTLITVRYALEYGREILAVPGSPLDPRSYGTNTLIRQGATLVSSSDEVLEAVLRADLDNPADTISVAKEPLRMAATINQGAKQYKGVANGRTAAIHTLLQHLSYTPCAFAELYEQTNLEPQMLGELLVELELAGKVQRSYDNKISLAVPSNEL